MEPFSTFFDTLTCNWTPLKWQLWLHVNINRNTHTLEVDMCTCNSMLTTITTQVLNYTFCWCFLRKKLYAHCYSPSNCWRDATNGSNVSVLCNGQSTKTTTGALLLDQLRYIGHQYTFTHIGISIQNGTITDIATNS